MFNRRSAFFLSSLLIPLLANALEPGDFIASGPGNLNRIALSFDDGPGPWTERFLDLLDRYDVKATFFMEGEQAGYRASLAKKVAERGHEIGSHTLKHINYLKRCNQIKKETLDKGGQEEAAVAAVKNELLEDFKKSRAIIEKATGAKLKLCRMPHGIDRPWIHQVAKQAGFILVNWTYGSDWTSSSPQQQETSYIKAIKPGAILLFHDGGKDREKSLMLTEAVLKAAKDKGFEIIPIGQLLGVQPDSSRNVLQKQP